MSFGPPPQPARPSGGPGATGGQAARRGFRGAISSLEHPEYRWLYASNFAFFLAMSGQSIVRAWLAFELTGSELALGLVSFTVAVPMLLIAPIGGAMSDRLERRNLIAAGVMGCVFPFIMPARQALVVNIVGKRGLPNAMALSMAGVNVTRVVGPALAGFLIGPLGSSGTYTVGIALYGVALLTLLRVKRRPPIATAEVSVYANVLEGGRYVWEHRLVLILIFFGLVPMFLAMPFQSLLVVFAEEVWEVGPSGLGLLSAAGGIGGVAGSVYVAWRADSHRRVRRMMVSIIGFGAFLFAFSLTPYFWFALGLIFVANAFSSIYSTLNNTAIQMIIPDAVRGRISSFLMMSFSLPLLGTLPLSAVAEAYGAPRAVALASLLAVLVAIAFFAGSSKLRNMDASVRAAVEADNRRAMEPS